MFSIHNCIHIIQKNTKVVLEKKQIWDKIITVAGHSEVNKRTKLSLFRGMIFFFVYKNKLPHSKKKNHKIHVFTVQNYGNHVSYPIDVRNALEIRQKKLDVFVGGFPRKFRGLTVRRLCFAQFCKLLILRNVMIKICIDGKIICLSRTT